MRKFVTVILSALFLLSCSKDGDSIDYASAYVGAYSVSETSFAKWGTWSGTTTDHGAILITRISNTRVKIEGYIDAQGEVNSKALYIDGYRFTDSQNDWTVTFSPAYLEGNVLTWTANRSGTALFNGKWDPYNTADTFTAIRQ